MYHLAPRKKLLIWGGSLGFVLLLLIVASSHQRIRSTILHRTPISTLPVISQEVITADYHPTLLTGFIPTDSDDSDCADFSPSGVIYSTDKLVLHDSLKDIRDSLLKTQYKDLVTLEDEEKMNIDDILKRWYTLSGSSVWIPGMKAHLVVSRVMYLGTNGRSDPLVSFVRVQLFDPDFNELKDIALKFSDKPDGTVIFPYILPVDIPREGSRWLGPEDAKIAVNPETPDDPIVIFNMQNSVNRAMYGFYPFRPENKQVLFSIKDEEPRKKEKNWTPFFVPGSPTTVNFVYDLQKLTILKCSIITGICEKEFVSGDDGQNHGIGIFRGGSNLVPFPTSFTDKDVWVGFPKTHMESCGCSSHIYRPYLMVLVRKGDFYYKAFVSTPLDFGIDVRSWESAESTSCQTAKNVLAVNSISNWDLLDDGLDKDYMTITLSEADVVNSVLRVRGIAKFVDNLTMDDGSTTLSTSNKIDECATTGSKQYCQRYGELH
ncbi:Beta mannosyl transferase 4 [Komagataella phaffii]|nr:Hypothetical protein PAS_chr4_0471 [Komagataella phaffii GS115]AOA64517.1 GQ67_04830T0 [Komagataella phaffii]AOA70208.1 GQ68_04802T0 [Komagataella phaffii GS115]CAY71723.1 Hypothetical protein PAS_chr4_0471 [Komagataella phaffii GS115]